MTDAPPIRRRWFQISIFWTLLAVAGRLSAEEDGLSLLVNTAKHAGDQTIRSGEFAYMSHIITDPPPPERIKVMVEQSRADIRRSLDAAGGNETQRQNLQKALNDVVQSVASQVKRNANREWRYHFGLRVSDGHADRYAEFFPTDTEPDRKEHTHIVLLRPGLTVRQHGTLTTVGTDGVYIGQEPQHLGRLMGVLAERVTGKNEEMVRVLRDNVTSIEVEKLDIEQEISARKLSCHFEGQGARPTQVLIHVDPSRGYVTPLVQESDENGNTLREWIAEDYFQPEGSELWFPKSATYRVYPKMFGANRTEHYKFPANGIKLNTQMPDERFTILLKEGSTLLDNRNRANISYEVTDERPLSLGAVDNLEALPGLKRR